jgi:serine/threonine protein kinase
MGSCGSAVELPETGPRPEDMALPGMPLFGGMYTITRPVIRSGLGRVYGARDSLGRDIFLTVCSEGPFSNEDQTADPQDMPEQEDGQRQQIGFVLQEANCLSDMHHPNIVAFHQAFVSGNDAAWTSDSVLGPSLREVIDDPDRRLGPEQIISLACIMLDAIRSIHALGLLHGDVSVDTIFLDAEDEPLLIDFGAVRCTCAVPMDMPDELKDTSAAEDSAPDPACGPWRDLQRLAVALHHAITGRPIAEADGFSTPSVAITPVPRLAGSVVGYPPGFLESIDTALETPRRPASTQPKNGWMSWRDC